MTMSIAEKRQKILRVVQEIPEAYFREGQHVSITMDHNGFVTVAADPPIPLMACERVRIHRAHN
jgi:hypothetical protein